ncbi:hypothetical protein CHLNCDRAFT_140484 [Chlorella variabilis]|uniref:Cupin type-1 domain-containing protein n=1 Tax=Chlorella variabilis TaxID=554065 RepID=E1Z5H3_CHLVA|nr:hypothetical protein CHLNCDRAFT_140484 [Chlorella variabilis]EFN58471.1 hypothetical protein CHLNCDRAFT_140484 [Chlorella variabilis]|eukprot:XP_005850573.1 hypothetical protein CHLNCDRAFT_140484 [Chlorella variabilis]
MPRSATSLLLTSGLAIIALLLVSAPSARAGAVFEVREEVITNAANFRFQFGVGTNQAQSFPGAGSIKRSGGAGAGAVFKSSAIPLALFTLNRCTAVAVHVHPNSAETLFVTQGKIRIYQFRGEEDQANVRVTDISANQAGYIQQGAYHFVENISSGTTKFLQIFDHPQGGAVFAAPALVALRNAGGNAAAIVNSAFSSNVLGAGVTAKGAIINVAGCNW